MAEELTLPQLRFLTLESQGLAKSFPFGKGKNAVLKALEHLGYIPPPWFVSPRTIL
jgi:uncharacterized protein